MVVVVAIVVVVDVVVVVCCQRVEGLLSACREGSDIPKCSSRCLRRNGLYSENGASQKEMRIAHLC